MATKRKRKPKAATSDADAALAALTGTVVDLRKQLGDEILRNATPTMTMTAAAGHMLIVECEGFSMRVRTRFAKISTTRTD